MKRALVPGGAALGLVLAARVHAAATLVYDYSMPGHAPRETTVYVDSGRVRFEGSSALGPAAFQWNGTTKTMRMLNGTKKSYVEVTEREFGRFREQIGQFTQTLHTPETKERLAKMLKNLPPDRQKQVESQLDRLAEGAKGAPVPHWTFEKLGKGDHVAGYACEQYRGVAKAVHSTQDVCLVPWERSPLSRDDQKTLLDMADYFRKLVGAMAEQPLLEAWSAPGFPASTRTLDEHGAVRQQAILKRATKGPVDASLFEVPAGYREERLPAAK